MPVRIYDIAKKFGLESKEILVKAKALGIAAAKVPSSSLDKISAEWLEGDILKDRPDVAASPLCSGSCRTAQTPAGRRKDYYHQSRSAPGGSEFPRPFRTLHRNPLSPARQPKQPPPTLRPGRPRFRPRPRLPRLLNRPCLPHRWCRPRRPSRKLGRRLVLSFCRRARPHRVRGIVIVAVRQPIVPRMGFVLASRRRAVIAAILVNPFSVVVTTVRRRRRPARRPNPPHPSLSPRSAVKSSRSNRRLSCANWQTGSSKSRSRSLPI